MRKYFIPFIMCSLITNTTFADDLDSLGTIPTMIESSDVDTLAEQIKELRGRLEKTEHEIASLKQKIDNQQAIAISKAEPKTEDVSTNKTDPNEQFQASYALLKEKKNALAAKGFSQFIKDYPNHELTGIAHYWLGELSFSEARYEQAVIHYMKGYKSNPKGNRASDNLLKSAISLGKINKKPLGCQNLFKLQKEFPSLPDNRQKQLKEQLKLLSCE